MYVCILDQTGIYSLKWDWIEHALYSSICLFEATYCVRESNSKLELFYWLFVKHFSHIFSSKAWTEFETIVTNTKVISIFFNALQVLEWFLFVLGVTCIIFACAINTDVWQVIIEHAESGKNCSKPP